jgi:hypothetical protein
VEAFEAAFLGETPPRVGPPTVPPDREIEMLGPTEEALISERLRALGYIE